jgi:hypothetical protein
MPDTQQPDLLYLEAELARIDVLLRREVRRWVLAGQDPNDDYRGMYVTQAEAEALAPRPLGTSWGQWIELPSHEAADLAAAFDQAAAQIARRGRTCEAGGATPRLLQMAEDFGLDRTALDILLLCLAPAFDTKYERLYGYLQDNVTRKRPSVRLVLDLLGAPGVAKFGLAEYVDDDAPLCKHGLLKRVLEPPPAGETWLCQTLQADETLAAWLRGAYAPQGILRGNATLSAAAPVAAAQMLVGDLLPPDDADARANASQGPVIALVGSDGARQDAVAQVLAARAGRPLLTVNLRPAVSETAPAAEVVRTALRDARLTRAFLYLRQWDACLDGDGTVAPALLEDLFGHHPPVAVASEQAWQPWGIARTRGLRRLETGVPQVQHRRNIWRHYLEAASAAAAPAACDAPADAEPAGEATIEALAGQFALCSGAIRDAVTAAFDAAGPRPPTASDLLAAARACSNPRLQTLARKVAPRYAWDDIVLPPNQQEILRELVATIRQRSRVLQEWGVGAKLASSAGVTVLFAGPPGTGKTMAAGVVAGDLGLDLYKIDLAAVVSKYIGETEKNLERIFHEASSSNAILFFDEADAIFGKRSEVKDAHDRYANVEVSYLLQRMEAYDGVTILATNLRANLDEAFTRRLQFVVDFPFPRVEDRRRIWAALLPERLPRAGDLDFDLLARRYELAGGSIRNVIVAAAYLAASNGNVVTMEHLLHGVRREMQKMGRMVTDKDFAN